MVKYIIRDYRNSKSDLEKITNLWLRNNYFKGITKLFLKKHLQWKYNPKFTKLWIAEDRDNIFGSCGIITNPLFLKKYRIVNGNWGIDSLVDKSISNQNKLFLFFRVFRNALFFDHRRKIPFLTFSFPNEVIKDTYLKIGWVDVPIFWKFTKNLSVARQYKDDLCNSLKLKGIDFFLIAKFERKWDTILKNLCSKYHLINLRYSSYLNWRYFQCPLKKHFVFLIKNKDRIKGYLIVREEQIPKLKQGYVVDFLIDPNERKLYEICINFIESFFRKRGMHIIHWHISHKILKDILLKFDFTSARKVDFFIFAKDSNLLNKMLHKQDLWFITAGDGDFAME